jgi:hypothetical protein
MTLLYAVRYFVVVSVVPRLFLAGFIVAVAAAAVRLTSNPMVAIDVLTPVLLLQLFVAASGFQLPARRGHFDLLLTSGAPRWQIALAHCLVSIAPGIVSWVCVGMLELAAGHGSRSASFAAGTCAAFLGSSLVAWGAAVYSSRTAAAIGWLLVMTIPPIAHLVSPLRILGVPADSSGRFIIVFVSGSAVLACVAAFTCIVRGPTPLEAAQ